MKNLRFIFLITLLLGGFTLLKAQENCYDEARKKGIQLYNQEKYAAAYKVFEVAKLCTDIPANNDLNSWLDKCNIVVKLSVRELEFEATDNEEKCVEVTTNAKSFKVTSAPKWCKVSQQGKQLMVSCEDNPNVTLREGTVQITSGGKTASFVVSQHSADVELTFDPDSVVFQSSEETKGVIVSANVDEWSVEVYPAWITAERRKDTLVLVATKNVSSDFRKTQVSVKANDQLFSLPVCQMPGDTVVSADLKDMVFPKETKTASFRVSCNVSAWNVTASEPWIEAKRQQDEVKVTLPDNPSVFSRHGSVKVTSGRRSYVVQVHQAPYISEVVMPASDLESVKETTDETVLVTSIPSELVVYIDDSISRTTPFEFPVDFEHHSLLMGFERCDYLFNEKLEEVSFKPGLRFANITLTAPKNIGLRTGFVSANTVGAYAHFQASMPRVKEFLPDTLSPKGYHFMVGPVYQPIPYLGIYAGLGVGVYEGIQTSNGKQNMFPNMGLEYEAGVMGFYKNIMLSMGFKTARWGYQAKRTTFVFGIGGYLKRYYDPQLGYCCSDSRRWWSLNYMSRPAVHGNGLMFSDLGKGKTRAYLKAMYLKPDETIRCFDGSVGVVFTPVNGIIDMCVGLGASAGLQGTDEFFQGVGAEIGTIINLWRIPITVMFHESDLFNNRKLYVDFGIGFHLGDFNRSSYK